MKTKFIRRYQIILLFLFIFVIGSVKIFSREKITLPQIRYSVAITFDDGPHPDYTEKILEIFAKENAKATFFVVGKMVANYPELAQEICWEGHQIASHTYDHLFLTELSPAQIIEQLEKTRKIIKEVCRVDTYYFRPPGGHYSQKVIQIFSLLRYQMILWTLFPHDQAIENSDELTDSILSQVKDKDVILLHSGVEITLQALPAIISQLKKRGFQLVTVSDLCVS